MTKAEYFARFDAGVERRDTGCFKWDGMEPIFGRGDLLPFWVADMDFPAPPAVVEALTARAAYGVYGYTARNPEDAAAVVEWMQKRHDTQVDPDLVLGSPGVVDSLALAVSTYAKPGDLVALQPPVYGAFYGAVKKAGCETYRNPLLRTEAGWKMDLEGLERGLKAGAKLLLLCSPHNPVGRVWTRAELDAVGALCRRYGARVISDEIHADLEMPGHKHIPFLQIEPEAVVLISATKTFNLASLRYSSILFGDKATHAILKARWDALGVGAGNLFGELAQRVAYREGGEWLDALIAYIDENRACVEGWLKRETPQITCSVLEGTYLMWLDMRTLGLAQAELERLLVEKAGVALSPGTNFGEEGAGYMRLNLATPRKNIERAMAQITKVIRAHS